MSSRISSTMHLGQRAMMNSQTALHTASHNIANRQTEGYSRQKTETFSNQPYGMGKVRIGTGARAASVQRVNNPYLEKQLGNEQSQLAFLEGQSQAMSRLEQVYNEQSVEGLNSSLQGFFNSFSELSTNPESIPKRIAVKESADLLSRDFHRVATQLKEIRGDANAEVAVHVNEINGILQEVAQLNNQVQKVEIGGGYANDERDRRDLLIKKLGELVDIRWTEGEDKTVTISAGSNAILVTGFDAKRLEAVPTPASGNKAEGDYDVVYYHNEYAEPLVLTDRIKGGKLGGVLGVRDGDIAQFSKKIDDMAFAVAEGVNDIHEQGYNAFNQTGVLFFEPLANSKDAAENFRINPQVQADVGRIATAVDPNLPGDNRITNMISEFQHSKTMFDGTTSIDEYYNGMVAELGLRAQKANRDVESQQGVVKQLENLRESISGVSLDEEVASMMEWQKQFDASARVIRTADEMLDTVLNIKRY